MWCHKMRRTGFLKFYVLESLFTHAFWVFFILTDFNFFFVYNKPISDRPNGQIPVKKTLIFNRTEFRRIAKSLVRFKVKAHSVEISVSISIYAYRSQKHTCHSKMAFDTKMEGFVVQKPLKLLFYEIFVYPTLTKSAPQNYGDFCKILL